MNRSLMAEHQLCDQRARAALEAEQWPKALEQLERAQALLRDGLSRGPEPAELPWEAHAKLVNALVGAVHKRIMAGEEGGLEAGQRAELCWQLQGLLERHRALPVVRPAWLPVAEEQLVRHGALLWREAIGAKDQAGERALAMLRRLALLLDPCPAWVNTSLRELESYGPMRLELVLRPGQEEVIAAAGQRLFNLAPALDAGGQEPPHQRLASFLRERAMAAPGLGAVAIGHPLSSLSTDLAVLALLGEEPPPEWLTVLPRAAAAWLEEARALGTGVNVEPLERPATELEGNTALIELDAIELAVLQVVIGQPEALAPALATLERHQRDPGFWRQGERHQHWWRQQLDALDVLRRFARERGFYANRAAPAASLEAWSEAALAALAEALLLERAALWSTGEAAQWLLLPVQQAICRGTGRLAVVGRRPEAEALLALLAGQHVLYVGPLAEAVETQWRQGRCWRLWQGRELAPHGLRCVALPESRYPRRPHAGFEASLAHTLATVDQLLQERPASVALIGPGAYRLPLLRALTERQGLRCLAFGKGLPQLYGVELPRELPMWGAEARNPGQWCRLAGEG